MSTEGKLIPQVSEIDAELAVVKVTAKRLEHLHRITEDLTSPTVINGVLFPAGADVKAALDAVRKDARHLRQLREISVRSYGEAGS